MSTEQFETTIGEDLQVTVIFEHQPAEPDVGIQEYIECEDIVTGPGSSLMGMLHNTILADIEQKCWEHVQEDGI